MHGSFCLNEGSSSSIITFIQHTRRCVAQEVRSTDYGRCPPRRAQNLQRSLPGKPPRSDDGWLGEPTLKGHVGVETRTQYSTAQDFTAELAKFTIKGHFQIETNATPSTSRSLNTQTPNVVKVQRLSKPFFFSSPANFFDQNNGMQYRGLLYLRPLWLIARQQSLYCWGHYSERSRALSIFSFGTSPLVEAGGVGMEQRDDVSRCFLIYILEEIDCNG